MDWNRKKLSKNKAEGSMHWPGQSRGILFAGNILADVVKSVDCYPEKGMLANILRVSQAVGGCVPNTAINLSQIAPEIPLSAIGLVGDDTYGRYLVSQLQRHGINTKWIGVSKTQPTSFSDVMSLSTGERTFFHARGANGEFSPANILLDELEGAILHIGYILLLDRFDEVDGEFGTVMARFLRDVQERGIKTSIDAVSDSTADYPGKLIPALKYSNYAIMNEIESCNIWGLSPRGEDGRLNIPNIRVAMEKMVEAGVKDKAIIHAKEAGFCLNAATGAFTAVGSLRIPSGKIKGSVGAGDAFCAGCLYGIYEGLEDREILELASGAAACSLLSENSVDGMRPKKEILKLMQQYGRLEV